jgi:DNA-directed RNA polymerase specialized sigma24 family protein
VHRHRLRREDLEDCYSQATLELLTRALNGAAFAGHAHVANALEQRFLSRVQDRRRALSGRSPMQAALETAMSIGSGAEEQIDVVDVRAELEQLVIQRLELRRLRTLVEELSVDQRMVLAGQLGQIGCAEFCSRFGWTAEKYRKVAQRARARLRGLMSAEDDVPPAPRASEQSTGTRP